jgi:quercetin dioxygenase-like cupin family protein
MVLALSRDEGDPYWITGTTLDTIKITAGQTGGAFALLEARDRRGDGPPRHVHEREDEAYYILEGTYTFFIGDETIVGSKDAFVFAPRGVPHTFRADTDTARHLHLIAPGGFEGFLAQIGTKAVDRNTAPVSEEPPDVEAMGKMAAQYGVTIVGPPPGPA